MFKFKLYFRKFKNKVLWLTLKIITKKKKKKKKNLKQKYIICIFFFKNIIPLKFKNISVKIQFLKIFLLI